MGVIDVAMEPVAPFSAGMDASGVDVMSDPESEDLRWRQWKAKGRADDLRFRHRLRTVLVDIAAVITVVGALWLAFLI